MGTPSILAIDDDETILSAVSAVLEKHGFSVKTTTDAEEGLNIVSNDIPDGVILDIKMPTMSGKDVLEKMKSNVRVRDVPVMMLTGETDVRAVSALLKIGACDYIVKPFDHDNLVVRVRKMVGA